MPFIQGLRGPEPMRWCGCGNHLLEVIGMFHTAQKTIEYSHMPKCPVCQDDERRLSSKSIASTNEERRELQRESTGAGVA